MILISTLLPTNITGNWDLNYYTNGNQKFLSLSVESVLLASKTISTVSHFTSSLINSLSFSESRR